MEMSRDTVSTLKYYAHIWQTLDCMQSEAYHLELGDKLLMQFNKLT